MVDSRSGSDAGGARLLLRALPPIVFAITFGLFFVDKNREARSVLTSTRGLAAVVAIVATYVVIGLGLRRSRRLRPLAPVITSGVIVVLAAWIVRPYYVDETANRRLAGSPVEGPVEKQASLPVRVSTGAIRGIGHDGKGSASIIRNPDGSRVLRFENLDVDNTPDPRVYLVEGEDVRRPGGLELGRLAGNRATVLDYQLPPTDAGPGWTVLVWCRAFAVPIANATQAPA